MADEPVPAPTPTPTPEPQAPPAAVPPAVPASSPSSSDEPLGAPGLRALQAEREARQAAERQLRESQQRTDELNTQLTDATRRAGEVDQLRARMDAADERARRANLAVALVGQGYVGSQAAGVASLLSDVEFNDDQQPTNLADRLTAAKAIYPADWFASATPASASQPPPPAPVHPNLHNGPRPNVPDADEDDRFAAAMTELFPGVMPQQSSS